MVHHIYQVNLIVHIYPQLKKADEINNIRLSAWNYYANNLKELEEKGKNRNTISPRI